MFTDEQLRQVVQGPGDVEWRYEMRRECQEILNGLYLGPFVASKSLPTLQGLGITHIVCIRDAKEAFSVKPRFPEHFQYMTLDVEDNEEQNLIKLFPGAKTFIDTAIKQGGRVLVHCNGGISLSPSFVVMFVMQHYMLSWEDALHLVQNRRYCISPNGGFLTQIKEYESIYRANIAVASYPQVNRGPPATNEATSLVGGKRRASDEDEDDSSRTENNRKRPLLREDTADIDPNAMET